MRGEGNAPDHLTRQKGARINSGVINIISISFGNQELTNPTVVIVIAKYTRLKCHYYQLFDLGTTEKKSWDYFLCGVTFRLSRDCV